MTPVDFTAIITFLLSFTSIFTFNQIVRDFGTREGAYFTVAVADESFCLYLEDPDEIQLAIDNFYHLNTVHPSGRIMPGSGGFNYGYGGLPDNKYWRYWSWHFDPTRTHMAELSIEICDGLPSAVEYGPLDTGGYCPWLAQVTALSCPHP